MRNLLLLTILLINLLGIVFTPFLVTEAKKTKILSKSQISNVNSFIVGDSVYFEFDDAQIYPGRYEVFFELPANSGESYFSIDSFKIILDVGLNNGESVMVRSKFCINDSLFFSTWGCSVIGQNTKWTRRVDSKDYFAGYADISKGGDGWVKYLVKEKSERLPNKIKLVLVPYFSSDLFTYSSIIIYGWDVLRFVFLALSIIIVYLLLKKERRKQH
jgi:hypothetical protein